MTKRKEQRVQSANEHMEELEHEWRLSKCLYSRLSDEQLREILHASMSTSTSSPALPPPITSAPARPSARRRPRAPAAVGDEALAIVRRMWREAEKKQRASQ